MLEHLNIEPISQDSFDDGNSSTFKTSSEVIQKVMNVPMCAVMSILRSNGYNDIHDETSLCIDEERLGVFAEAYVRKMKIYFTRSLQNISSLPRKERSDYNKFVKLFKKKGVKEPKIWKNDIDIDHLKEVFVERVKEETEERYSSRSGMQFLISSDVLINRILTYRLFEQEPFIKEEKHINFSDYAYKLILYVLGITFEKQAILEKRIEEEKELLNRISDSELYIAEPINDKPLWCGINFISRFVSFARYYIYSMRDDEDSHSADINFLRVKNNYSISTGLRLCS
ncbi:hypothetical protein [Phocaeicola coprocola]|uniref:hypothetical protein n=1 Tax=Phocaeicola coprocola TaxID=310298 RepID=UPI004024CC8E